MKFHINPETGNVGQCKAEKQCRFGGSAAHYGSADEAREAYEVTQQALVNMEAEELAEAHSAPHALKTIPNTVKGEVDENGFVASTYPSYQDWSPKPVKAEVVDAKTGKTGFIAVRPRQGYKTHIMRDQPSWRQGMGLGKLIIYGRSLCGEAGKGSSMIVGGHNDPTSPSEAMEDSQNACAGCAKKFQNA